MRTINVAGQELQIVANDEGREMVNIEGEWMPYARSDAGIGKVHTDDGWTVLHKPLAAERVPEQVAPSQQTSTFGDAVTSFGEGATFGYQDEMLGAVMAPFTERTYAQMRDAVRRRQGLAKKNSPYAAGGANLVGSIGSSIAGGGGINPTTIGGMAKVAGVEGALAGHGYSESDTAYGQARDTAAGGATGALLGALLGKGTQWGTEQWLSRQPATQAGRKFTETMDNDYINEADIRKFLDANADNVPADMGINMRSATARLANEAGPARTIAVDFLEGRQFNQQNNLIELLLGKTKGETDFHNQVTSMVKKTREESQDLYRSAHGQQVEVDDWLQNLADDKDLKPIWEQANKLYRLKTGVEPRPDGIDQVQYLDYFKQALDDNIERAYRAGDGNLASALKDKKMGLVNYIDDQVPVYGDARKAYQKGKKVENALEDGRKILRTDADAPQISNLSVDEKKAYVNGATRAIRDKIMMGPESANQARNLIKSPLIRERLRGAFPSTKAGAKSFDEFIDQLEVLSNQSQTYGAALQGSRTAPMQMEGNNLNGIKVADVGVEAMQGNLMNAGVKAANLLAQSTDALGPKGKDELLKMLLQKDADKLFKGLQTGKVNQTLINALLGIGPASTGYSQ